MKIKGNISILIGREVTRIEIKDSDAATHFLEIQLNPDQLARILSRESRVECEMDVRGLDRIGKKHENESFVFEIPEEINAISRHHNRDLYNKNLKDHAQTLLSDGWIADGYFGSQGSFFEKDGKKWARTTIRRWI